MNWKEWLAERLPSETDRDNLQEFMGMCTLDRQVTKAEKMLLLYGKKANGKSTFRRTIARFCSETNTNISITPFVSFFRKNTREYMIDLMQGNNICSACLEWSDVKRHLPELKIFIQGEPMYARSSYGVPYTTAELPFLIAETNTNWSLGDYSRYVLHIEMTPIPEPYNASMAYEFDLNEVAEWIKEGAERFTTNGYKFTNN